MANVIGADKLARKLKSLPAHLEAKVGAAVKKSADELVRTSKVLIPVGGDIHGDGHEREKIKATQVDVMAVEVDFGPKAKVIEGDKGPRPFVNPALKVTRKRNGARIRRAVKAAVKAAMNGG